MTELFSQVDFTATLLGGVLIGLAVTALMLLIGRVAGICGITFSLFEGVADKGWRITFLISLVAGTVLIHFLSGKPAPAPPSSNLWLLITAGLLTGFGTKLANGCTSGHGVCGIARLSTRSIVATLVFMASGMAAVFVLNQL